MRPHPRLTARTAAFLAGALLPLWLLAGSAQAQAPGDTGWWNQAAREGLPQPPSPPDVQEGDLLVQAGDPTGITAGRDDATPAPSAVAALRFTLADDGSRPGPLTLTIASGGTAMDVRAYPTTDPWKPAFGAPLSQAPAPDLSRFSVGVLDADGVHLVFADIARVAPETGPLSIVLLPGATDRVVIKKPDASVLVVQAGSPDSFGGAPPPATFSGGDSGSAAPPTFDSGPADPGQPLDSQPSDSGAFDSGSSGTGPAGGGTAFAPELAGPDPVPAPDAGTVPPAAAPQAVRPVSSVVPGLSDDRTRYFAVAEALLVLITFGLLGWGPFARLAELTGTAAPQTEARARGVGRFTADRSGRPAKL